MAAREKRAKTPAADGSSPKLTNSGRVVKSRLAVEEKTANKKKVVAKAAAAATVTNVVVRRRGRPSKCAAVAEKLAKTRAAPRKSDGDVAKLVKKKQVARKSAPAKPEDSATAESPAEDAAAEIKQERESPAPSSDSRCSSPRVGRRPRAGSDVQPSVLSPLRSGKQRSTAKQSLLSEVVEQEGRKRKRAASEAKSDAVEPDKKPKVEVDEEPEAKPETPPVAEPMEAEEVDSSDATVPPSPAPSEKIAEKTLILDNMSKAFNDAPPVAEPKSIRRSARRRKSTAKAKGNDELVKDGDSDAKPEEDVSTAVEDAAEPPEAPAAIEVAVVAPPPPPPPVVEDSKVTDPIDESSKENVRDSCVAKSYEIEDFGKLIDRLKCLEEQDRKRQEEISRLNSRTVMVSEDVVLIPKTNVEPRPPKEPSILPPTTIEKTREKENVLGSLEMNSAISIIRKDQMRKSFDAGGNEQPQLTLVKRSSSVSSRKRSTGSKDDNSITIIDKSLGKEVTLDIRKSIDKGIVAIEPSNKPPPPPPIAAEAAIEPAKEVAETIEEKPASEEESPAPPAADRKAPPVDVAPSEDQTEKEIVLKSLGLLSLEAANRAKIDKQRQKELLQQSSGKNQVPPDVYTGTLKTVIKLNRTSPDKKRGRSPLKMTFQKSKGRNSKLADAFDSRSDDYYTIHNKEFGGSSSSSTGSSDNHMTSGGHRKTHYSNRFNNESTGHDPIGDINIEANTSSKETAANLVIPEKASSFSIHPGRVCQDQCFYCGGKFGLFDTPCHIAQIKSSDRQKKILESEEKLTVDSCLCDACYRHVDRRANCPSYRKRAGPISTPPTISNSRDGDVCFAKGCGQPAPHTHRRKWLVKIKKSLSKVVQLDLDYPGLHTIPLCDQHYQAVSQLMVCGLCKRRLSRNHIHYIYQEYKLLNPLLKDQGVPVIFEEKPVVCKLCRYYCTLLLRPPDSHQVNKIEFLKSHRRRLLQAHNVKPPAESDTDYSDEPSETPNLNHDQNGIGIMKERKRGRKKKIIDSNKLVDENSINDKSKNTELWKKSNVQSLSAHRHQNSVEDVESLISSNKILVSGAKSGDDAMDYNDITDTMIEYDNPLLMGMDKNPSELQNLLQKCNVPSTTILHKITDKPKNILKVHNAVNAPKKLSRRERRIQKLGRIITHKADFEETLGTKLPNRNEFTIEPMNNDEQQQQRSGNYLLKNIALNDECTIETIPAKNPKSPLDINSLKSKWVMTESYSQVKKNLTSLSKNLSSNDHHKKKGDQFSNPVQRLETNPSISVRELFPGEEEMNLQCSIEFGNVKGVTPEGWEKCNSVIQYDNYTKNLWQELQKPYGNQSSFLRHLILLEKYYRNGDLILSQHANCNAITYSESVQNRLRSYDNIPSNNGDVSINLVPNQGAKPQYNGVSITPQSESRKGDVDFRKPSNISAGKSLLKSNQSHSDTPKTTKTSKADGKTAKNIQNLDPKVPKGMPASLTHLEKLGNQLTPIQPPIVPRPSTPRPDTVKPNSDMRVPVTPELKTITPKSDNATAKAKTSSLPPELIAINQTIPKKSIENALKNIHAAKASSTPVSVAQQLPPSFPLSVPNISPIPSSSKTAKTKFAPIAPKELKKTGKSSQKKTQWRPTLIPITDESKTHNEQDVLHQTADGRRLPSLVKVTFGGQPYHITIEDYNRMCIMRREKMQQEKKSKNSQSSNKTDESLNISTTNIKVTEAVEIEKSLPEKSAVTTTTTTATTKVVENNNDGMKSILQDFESSLLKNVTLKNITIAPVTTSSESKASVNSNTSQSLLITNTKNTVETPIMSTDIDLTNIASFVVPITSQAVILPKIPKSLTVIPQAMTTTVIPSPVTTIEALSVLPIPSTITLSNPSLAVVPTEP